MQRATQPNNVKPVKLIEYGGEKSGAVRLITVIDEQAYYKSTGETSGMPDIWLPFVMCAGSIKLRPNQQLIAPKTIIPYVLRGMLTNPRPRLLFKNGSDFNLFECIDIDVEALNKIFIKYGLFQPQAPKENDPYEDHIRHRLAQKKHLLTSIRLSRTAKMNDAFMTEVSAAAKLTSAEVQEMKSPILLEKQPEFSTADPNVVNQWVLLNGAKDIHFILAKNQWLPNYLPVMQKLYTAINYVTHDCMKGGKFLQRFRRQEEKEENIALRDLFESIKERINLLLLNDVNVDNFISDPIHEICRNAELFLKKIVGEGFTDINAQQKQEILDYCAKCLATIDQLPKLFDKKFEQVSEYDSDESKQADSNASAACKKEIEIYLTNTQKYLKPNSRKEKELRYLLILIEHCVTLQDLKIFVTQLRPVVGRHPDTSLLGLFKTPWPENLHGENGNKLFGAEGKITLPDLKSKPV